MIVIKKKWNPFEHLRKMTNVLSVNANKINELVKIGYC